MNKIKLVSQLFAISTLCIGITACGGGGGDSTTPPTPTPTVNNPPTVSAGSAQSIDEQSMVMLTANASDSDGSIAAYQWTQTAGDIMNLSGTDSANASFTAPTVLVQHGPQSFTFQAQVTDNNGASATDTVVITVNPVNSAPILDAGSTQIVNEGSLVQLSATATDDDGSLENILWTQTAGETVQLTDDSSLTPRFTTPNNEDSATFSFSLKVTDNEGSSEQSDVDIDVRPIITGLVVDDVLSNATVQLLNVADQSLILETQTDENGRYVLAQQQSLPPRYVLSITGGTLNGQPFLGTLNSICMSAERLSCHATPLSTLIKRYADQQGTIENGDKTLWLETLSLALGFDLVTQPFINEDETIVPLSTIREFLQNGAQLEQWLTTTLDYVENDMPNEDVESWFPTANLAPIANAGDDQTVNEQTSVTLNATASDPDGTIVSFLWTQTSGASVNLSDATSPTVNLTTPTATRVATLTFSLTVTDNDGGTNSDSMVVTVNPINILPSINAGDDQSVDEQTMVTLTPTISDSDGAVINILWAQISGTSVNLSDTTTEVINFITPKLVESETLTFSLTVIDNEGGTSTDLVNVTVNPVNSLPTVSAGADQTVDEQTAVSMTSTISDSDGNIAGYQWTQSSGTSVTLSNATTATAGFTSPVATEIKTLNFTLTATDNEGAAVSDLVSITVNPVNALPTVNAGADQVVDEQSRVTLNAIASDSDGNIDSYLWVQTSGGSITLRGASSATASFTARSLTEAQTLIFRLTVTDNEGGESIDTVNVTVNPLNPSNTLPTVNAGDTQSVDEQTTVTLNATASDSDGSISAYQWTQTGGTSVTLNNATTAEASFTAPTLTTATSLSFSVAVVDNEGGGASDNTEVTVNPVNTLPTVSAGNDKLTAEHTLVTLTATASDSDGNIVSYQWEQTSGIGVTLSGSDSATATFTAPITTLTLDMAFRVTATDNENGSSSDIVEVRIKPVNDLPTISAGDDQTVNEHSSVTLTATASDTDGSISVYQWSQTSGTSVSMSNVNSASASFTAPAITEATTLSFAVTATDNEGGAASDSVNVTVNPVNDIPVANAGDDQALTMGATVSLSGSQSSDPDGDTITYDWSLTTIPSGSTAVLSSTTNQDSSFVADLAGTYVASLTVSDAELISNADTVQIVVSPVNSAPTGAVSISGTTESGELLTASNTLADANGLGSFNYQWLRSQNDIDGATSSTYTLTNSDVGNTIAVKISYTDGDNFAESLTSDETATITEAVSAGKPNILLLIADDQGLDASAQYAYSSDLPSTPNIDALAAAGIIFDNAWATPQCTTTRGTMITGQHGVNSGITFVPAVMAPSTQTLQRYLKEQTNSTDYQTAVIGKWHLGGGNPSLSHPTDSGVDYYAGTITGTVEDYYSWDLTENGQSSTSTDYHTTKLTDLAISWLDTQNQANTPWFLWMAYVAPHSPFHLPPESLHNRTDLTGTADDIEANKRAYYLAALEAMDSEIGRLIDSLPAKERDNTLIVYIGDNGTPSAVIDTAVFDRTHSKSTLYEGGIRIPMVVSGNGVTRTNERETALVNTADFYATFTNFTGSSNTQINDSYSFLSLLSSSGSGLRSYNYSEFESTDVTGWTVRNQDHKLIEYTDGTQELYKVSEDLNETTNLASDSSNAALISELQSQGKTIRGETSTTALDITNATLTNRSANCADYVESYQSTVNDVNNGQIFNGALTVSLSNDKCVFATNNIPNHDFNDGSQSFPNNVSAQDITLEVTANPAHATSTTSLTLRTDNAVMLNGVKVDLLAAACFGVGDGKVGCNDINQPWRFDPTFVANGFRVDTHNAHSQPNGSYHYHGTPNALFDGDTNAVESPVIGFAADGYPIFGSYFDDNGTIRKAVSSFALISGSRPSGNGLPGGTYDGTYRDDYEYVSGGGDLDECNGMTVDGVYGYYVTDGYPYILSCFKGTVDSSFNK